jgi:hypothetical protein
MRTRAPAEPASTATEAEVALARLLGIGSAVADREVTPTTRAFLVATIGVVIALVVLVLGALL